MARSKKSKSTTHGMNFKVFGTPRNLKNLQLPTIVDVIHRYLQVQEELNPGLVGEDPSFTEEADIVCKKRARNVGSSHDTAGANQTQ